MFEVASECYAKLIADSTCLIKYATSTCRPPRAGSPAMRAPAAHTCFTRRAAKLPAAVVAAGCRDADEVDNVWLSVLEMHELVVVDM